MISSSGALSPLEESGPRYSDERWKVRIKIICGELGTYSYLEVKNGLKALTRPKTDENDAVLQRRKNVGCYLPTDRQLQQYLMRASWSEEIRPAEKHRPALYRFYEPSQIQIPSPRR
jgi:hypothetical protein